MEMRWITCHAEPTDTDIIFHLFICYFTGFSIFHILLEDEFDIFYDFMEMSRNRKIFLRNIKLPFQLLLVVILKILEYVTKGTFIAKILCLKIIKLNKLLE